MNARLEEVEQEKALLLEQLRQESALKDDALLLACAPPISLPIYCIVSPRSCNYRMLRLPIQFLNCNPIWSQRRNNLLRSACAV